MELARRHIHTHARSAESTSEAASLLFYTWLVTATEIFFGKRHEQRIALDHGVPEGPGGIDWQRAASFVVKCIDDFPDDSKHSKRWFEFWLMRITLNLAPERAIPNTVAEAFVSAGLLERVNPVDLEGFKTNRVAILKSFWQANYPGLGLMLVAPSILLERVTTHIDGIVSYVSEHASNLRLEEQLVFDGAALLHQMQGGDFQLTADRLEPIRQLCSTFDIRFNEREDKNKGPGFVSFRDVRWREYEDRWSAIRQTLMLLNAFPEVLAHPFRNLPQLCVTRAETDRVREELRSGRPRDGW